MHKIRKCRLVSGSLLLTVALLPLMSFSGCGGGVGEALILATATAIIGRVLDATNLGKAIDKAIVKYIPQGTASSRAEPQQVMTDEQGYYRLENVATGQGTLSVSLPDGSYSRVDITVNVQGITTVDVKLVPRGAIPVGESLIVSFTNLPSQAIPVGGTWQFNATTTANMSPTFLVEGDIGSINSTGLFTATKPGTGRVIALLSQGDTPTRGVASVTVVAPPEPKSVITGRVVDEAGEYVRGATVEVDGKSTMTAEDGSYTIADLTPGNKVITATKNQKGTLTTTLTAGQGRVEVLVLGQDRPLKA